MNKVIGLLTVSSLFIFCCQAQENMEPSWLDTMHENIVESVNDSALWFDEFFVLDQNSLSEQALGEARIQFGWSPRSRELNNFESRLKLRYKLPNLKNRVDLVISDYDDEQADNPLHNTKIDNRSEQNRFSLALQWKAKPDSGLSHRIGIGRRLQPFIKSRYRNIFTISPIADLRFETSAYYYSNDGFGADFSVRYSYLFTSQSMFRFNNQFYFKDNSDDWLWQHSWQQLTQFNEKIAVINGFYIEGLSRPNYHLEEYLVSSRWRVNALKDWLFFEIEPFVTWRKDEKFAASYGISLRVEGFFGQT